LCSGKVPSRRRTGTGDTRRRKGTSSPTPHPNGSTRPRDGGCHLSVPESHLRPGASIHPCTKVTTRPAVVTPGSPALSWLKEKTRWRPRWREPQTRSPATHVGENGHGSRRGHTCHQGPGATSHLSVTRGGRVGCVEVAVTRVSLAEVAKTHCWTNRGPSSKSAPVRSPGVSNVLCHQIDGQLASVGRDWGQWGSDCHPLVHSRTVCVHGGHGGSSLSGCQVS
jgi:hypothetical protein